MLLAATVGHGGIAANEDGTLLVCVDCCRLGICAVGADGTTGPPAYCSQQSITLRGVCFARRSGVDTVLACDAGRDCVIEISAAGEFLRLIDLSYHNSWPYGVAYCGQRDAIAVSLHDANSVVLLRFQSAEFIMRIGSGAPGSADKQLHFPRGIRFTADGRHLLVADCYNHRVGKFSADDGAFVAHVATAAANGIAYPTDVLQREDGVIVVAEGVNVGAGVDTVCGNGSIVFIEKDGVATKYSGLGITPWTLCRSHSFCGIIVKDLDSARIVMWEDAWYTSRRRAWVANVTAIYR